MNRKIKNILLTILLLCMTGMVAILGPIYIFQRMDEKTINHSDSIEEEKNHIEITSDDLPIIARIKQYLEQKEEQMGTEREYIDSDLAMQEVLEGGIVPSSIERAIKWGENDIFYGYEKEEQSGKILNLLIDIQHPIEEEIGISRVECMKNYIKYMGLDLLGDWRYTNNQYYSKKADLCVAMEIVWEKGYFSIGFVQQETT